MSGVSGVRGQQFSANVWSGWYLWGGAQKLMPGHLVVLRCFTPQFSSWDTFTAVRWKDPVSGSSWQFGFSLFHFIPFSSPGFCPVPRLAVFLPVVCVCVWLALSSAASVVSASSPLSDPQMLWSRSDGLSANKSLPRLSSFLPHFFWLFIVHVPCISWIVSNVAAQQSEFCYQWLHFKPGFCYQSPWNTGRKWLSGWIFGKPYFSELKLSVSTFLHFADSWWVKNQPNHFTRHNGIFRTLRKLMGITLFSHQTFLQARIHTSHLHTGARKCVPAARVAIWWQAVGGRKTNCVNGSH